MTTGGRVARTASAAARLAGRWLLATAYVGAAMVAVTLARGGTFHMTVVPCAGSPDVNLKELGVMSVAAAAPITAAWSAARARPGRRLAAWALLAAALLAAAAVVLAALMVFTTACV